MTMVWNMMIPGIAVGIVGIILLLCLIPVCKGLPTIPTAMPGIIMFQTMVMHIPMPNTTVEKIPNNVVAIAFPLNTMAGLPSILRRTHQNG